MSWLRCRRTGSRSQVDGSGEYVSVSSQADTERADLAREAAELSANPEFEIQELSEIYIKRGVDEALARQR